MLLFNVFVGVQQNDDGKFSGITLNYMGQIAFALSEGGEYEDPVLVIGTLQKVGCFYPEFSTTWDSQCQCFKASITMKYGHKMSCKGDEGTCDESKEIPCGSPSPV